MDTDRHQLLARLQALPAERRSVEDDRLLQLLSEGEIAEGAASDSSIMTAIQAGESGRSEAVYKSHNLGRRGVTPAKTCIKCGKGVSPISLVGARLYRCGCGYKWRGASPTRIAQIDPTDARNQMPYQPPTPPEGAPGYIGAMKAFRVDSVGGEE